MQMNSEVHLLQMVMIEKLNKNNHQDRLRIIVPISRSAFSGNDTFADPAINAIDSDNKTITEGKCQYLLMLRRINLIIHVQ